MLMAFIQLNSGWFFQFLKGFVKVNWLIWTRFYSEPSTVLTNGHLNTKKKKVDKSQVMIQFFKPNELVKWAIHNPFFIHPFGTFYRKSKNKFRSHIQKLMSFLKKAIAIELFQISCKLLLDSKQTHTHCFFPSPIFHFISYSESHVCVYAHLKILIVFIKRGWTSCVFAITKFIYSNFLQRLINNEIRTAHKMIVSILAHRASNMCITVLQNHKFRLYL